MNPIHESSPTGDSQPPVRAVTRAAASWSERRYHRLILGICVGILVASVLLRVEHPTHVSIPGLGIPLPSACMFRNLTGIDCPGCGLTRSFVCLAHGQWRLAWDFHPMGWVFFGIVVAQIPFRMLQLCRLKRGQSPIDVPGVIGTTWVLMVILVLQWVMRGISERW